MRLRWVFSQCLSVCVLAGVVSFGSLAVRAAYCEIVCLSVKLDRVDHPTGYLEFFVPDSHLNGELYLMGSSAPRSHQAIFRMLYRRSSFGGFASQGTMDLDIPWNDIDGNGLPDLLEVDLSIEATTNGEADVGRHPAGTVTAVWRRDAGSKVGNCELSFAGMNHLGGVVNETYVVPFEVIAYRGPLRYTADGGNVSAVSELWRLDSVESKLSGPLTLTRQSPTALVVAPGAMTDQDGDELEFQIFDTFEQYEGAFLGFFFFDDFLRVTAVADYRLCAVVLVDSFDHDLDGVPNLGDLDATGSFAPLSPDIELVRAVDDLRALISGTPGQVVHLETVSSLSSPQWSLLQLFQIGREPMVIELDIDSEPAAFWRVVPD